MTIHTKSGLVVLAATAMACAAQTPGGALSPLPAQDKIDAPVRAAMDSGPVQVLLLGRTQLLAPRDGFTRFRDQHQGADRRVLRTRVINDLQQIAQREQPRILAALGRTAATRSLWIVNALVLTLTPDEIRRAAASEHVAFVYRTTESIGTPSPGGDMPVLPPGPRREFSPAGKKLAWNLAELEVPRVWRELGVTGEGATVAVLDFGVNYLHQDLAANVWRNAREIPSNGIDDDGNGYVDDVHGYDFGGMTPQLFDSAGAYQHGTVVSGIVAGDGTGGTITGLAPRAQLMMMRGNGSSAAALAHEYALTHGADVLSMSFSLANQGNLRGWWRMMSDHATAAGLFLVGGAGNFRMSATLPVQHWAPKDAPNVMSVGGVDSLRQIVPFSSGGPAEWSTVALYNDYRLPGGITKPDVVGFPSDYPILGAGRTGYVDPNPNVKGNSFSGPQGAGIAALMFSKAPSLPAWIVRDIIEGTARDLGAPAKDNDFGAGLMDAFRAVQEAGRIAANRSKR